MSKSVFVILVSIMLLSGCAGTDVDADKTPYVSLFNGSDLDGWVVENNAAFSARDGLLVLNKGVGWLRSEEEFGDFVLEMDFRFLEKGANSGIFVRTGPTSNKDENGWPDNGYQVQCKDTVTEERALGTMIPYGAPPFTHKSDRDAIARAYRPTTRWNHYEITCKGEDLAVKLNGVLVTTASEIKNLRGHVGIQAEHGHLEFRNIRIRRLN
ncbi:MAG: 3-keto-disaccharide hydrolase [Planctomycetota bacterium]